MAFESLSEKLNAAFKRLRGKGRLTTADVKEAMREVRMALLEADVSYKVVKDFTKTVTERASGADVLESLSPAQMVIKIVNEELCTLMGGANQKINISSKSPSVVMLVGRPSARSWICPCSRWARRTPWTLQRPPSSMPGATETIWCSSTRRAVCTSTSS